MEVNQQNQSVNTETYNLIPQKCGSETQQLLSTCLHLLSAMTHTHKGCSSPAREEVIKILSRITADASFL